MQHSTLLPLNNLTDKTTSRRMKHFESKLSQVSHVSREISQVTSEFFGNLHSDWLSVCFYMHMLEHTVLLCLHGTFYMLAHVHKCHCVHSRHVCVTVYAQLSWVTEFYRGGSMCTHTTPLTPGCHCAPVMINHVLQRLALFRREGTNHTPHYPGLVTLKQCSPRTPQPVAVWTERGREQVCVWKRERGRMRQKQRTC